MTAAQLLRCLVERGVSVRVDGPDLVLKPAHLVPPDWVPKIRRAKGELMALLSEGSTDTLQAWCWQCNGYTKWRHKPEWKAWVCGRCHPQEDAESAREDGTVFRPPHVGLKGSGDCDARAGGRYLLQRLWEAGYSLRLERSPYGPGYVIIPTGQPTKPVDFPALFELYDTFHDAAVKLLLEACQALKIDPTAWPDAVEKMAKESADDPENPELCPD